MIRRLVRRSTLILGLLAAAAATALFYNRSTLTTHSDRPQHRARHHPFPATDNRAFGPVNGAAVSNESERSTDSAHPDEDRPSGKGSEPPEYGARVPGRFAPGTDPYAHLHDVDVQLRTLMPAPEGIVPLGSEHRRLSKETSFAEYESHVARLHASVPTPSAVDVPSTAEVPVTTKATAKESEDSLYRPDPTLAESERSLDYAAQVTRLQRSRPGDSMLDE